MADERSPGQIRQQISDRFDQERRASNRRLALRMVMYALIIAAIIATVGTFRSWW